MRIWISGHWNPSDKPAEIWLTPGMLVGTHALLPVAACLLVDNLRLAAGLDRLLPRRSLWWVGVFGVLPDLFSPHLSLAARFASRSHSMVFLVGAIILKRKMETPFHLQFLDLHQIPIAQR
jgi:hypothetical protein